LDCNYTFSIDFAPSGIPIGANSIGKLLIQSYFGYFNRNRSVVSCNWNPSTFHLCPQMKTYSQNSSRQITCDNVFILFKSSEKFYLKVLNNLQLFKVIWTPFKRYSCKARAILTICLKNQMKKKVFFQYTYLKIKWITKSKYKAIHRKHNI